MLKDGRFTTIDEEKTIWQAQRLAAKLAEKSGLGNVQWGRKVPPLSL